MTKHNQYGAISGVVVVLVFVILLLIGAAGFGFWAYSSRQDYKNNTDQKIAAAVGVARQQEDTKQAAQYAEEAKNPLKTYNGPEAYGSLVISYPKTWSGYVNDIGSGSALLDGYFAPGVVPDVNGQSSIFALRVQVLNGTYASSLQNLSSLQQDGKVTVSAYSLPKLPKVVGVEVSGQLNGDNSTETMVILPLRSNTLEISTEGTQYLNDFNKYILPNFSFSP